MSARDRPPAPHWRSCLAPAALAAASVAHGQNAAPVSDADIERAKRLQPTVTEQDIANAKTRLRMPGTDDLRRVPVPQTPRIEALPVPVSPTATDLAALARGYAQSTDALAAAQGLHSGPALFIFVSFSMPEGALARLVDQAARAHGTLVLRGLVHSSLKDTAARVQRLIGQRAVSFQIDPQAFVRYGVIQAPTIVLVRDGTAPKPCASGICVPPDAYVRTAGDVTLDYALEAIVRTAPAFAVPARVFLDRLRS